MHHSLQNKWRGLIIILGLASVSYLLASLPWVRESGISSLVIAILLGVLLGNTWHHSPAFTPGIQFSAKRLLRLAIILYGFRVTFGQIASVGGEALVLDIFVVSLTLFGGYIVATKLFKLDRDTALLISAGSAICGAAAVLAVEDILKSEPYKATVAVGTVVLFGTLSMFLYPMLQHAGFFGFTANQFGMFTGASIHEVAQALVAGSNISNEAGKIAVIVKMMRVLLLVPVLFLLSALNNRFTRSTSKARINIPWFAVGFLGVIGFNSLELLPSSLVTTINETDTFLLTMAMGAIGVETKLSKIKKVGFRPLYLSLVLFIWLMASVFLMIKWL